jgi:hypothetical protein
MFEKNFIGKPEYMYNMGENGWRPTVRQQQNM